MTERGVPGFGGMAPDALTIALSTDRHTPITNAQNARDTTGWSVRQVIEDDLDMLRNIANAPEEALQDLIKLIDEYIPGWHNM